jgi:hypothetical protein
MAHIVTAVDPAVQHQQGSIDSKIVLKMLRQLRALVEGAALASASF